MKTKIILLAICLFTLVSCSAGKVAMPQPVETKPGAEAQPPRAAEAQTQTGVAQPPQPLDPFDKLALETLTYFTPIKGIVNSVEGAMIIASISAGRPASKSDGAKKGMRLGIFREGEPYYHPITRAEIAKTESRVGTAEIIEALAEGSKLAVIEGESKEGDIVRLSSAKIRVLFYQSKDVPWGVAEEYFDTLQKTGRFELIGASSLTLKEDALSLEAKKLGAELLLILSSTETEQGTSLSQKLLWSSDSKTLASSEALIERGYARELKVGEEFFSPTEKSPVKVFDLPFVSSLMAASDIDGDGNAELALSTGRDIVFYQPGVILKPALAEAEIKGARGEEHIYLDIEDLNGDGKSEILVVSLADDRVTSYLYEFGEAGPPPGKDGKFILTNKWNFFVRIIDGKLFGQDFMRGEGFRGNVFLLDASGARKTALLPAAVNLYDFVLLPEGMMAAYDNRGYLSVYDEKGNQLWRSEESLGGPVRVFMKEAPTEMAPKGEWSVKDRLIRHGDSLFAIKRVRVADTAPGFGFSHSEIKALKWNGASMEQKPLVELVPGNALDFAVIGHSIAALSREMKISNIIKGLGIMGTKLYVYPLVMRGSDAGPNEEKPGGLISPSGGKDVGR